MYFRSETYENLHVMNAGEYENCVFKNCDFSNGSLLGNKFIDCKFMACNLSMAEVKGAAFQDVSFQDCKMLGLRFDTANTFGISFYFEGCQLNHSSFYGLKLRKTKFKSCQLEGVDLGRCDLTESLFENCNLLQSIFDNTILEKADLRTAINLSLDPENNKLKKAKFSLSNISGLLEKYQIVIDRNL